ncbi:response regulator transcription factor [Halioxenophilus aromaticivorans]|uniref:Response regulator n=1 Tax=Halioxenophilus aromaticivorans TaxID=1306992 RepID=A0AAV3U0T5_9ALTE
MDKLRMMVVDDSNIIRRKIERSQQGGLFDVVGTAGSGVEALALFGQVDPDVVTMDITMPQMDGIECITQLKARKPEVKILVVSALSDKATGIEALECGAQGFLCKPFDDVKLNGALKELVGDSHV